MASKINSFKDLLIWQKSHSLALKIYFLSQGSKRNVNNFDIWSQCLRSAFSAPANIAEGYHSHKGKSFISFLEIARASAKETEYWTLVLHDTKNISQSDYESLTVSYIELDRMMNGLINKLRSR